MFRRNDRPVERIDESQIFIPGTFTVPAEGNVTITIEGEEAEVINADPQTGITARLPQEVVDAEENEIFYRVIDADGESEIFEEALRDVTPAEQPEHTPRRRVRRRREQSSIDRTAPANRGEVDDVHRSARRGNMAAMVLAALLALGVFFVLWSVVDDKADQADVDAEVERLDGDIDTATGLIKKSNEKANDRFKGVESSIESLGGDVETALQRSSENRTDLDELTERVDDVEATNRRQDGEIGENREGVKSNREKINKTVCKVWPDSKGCSDDAAAEAAEPTPAAERRRAGDGRPRMHLREVPSS